MDVVLNLLFESGSGLLILFTILFIIGKGFFLSAWMMKKMRVPEE